MDRIKLAGICVLASTLALSGCVTRTYNLTRDRVDQDLSATSGNRGFLMGNAPQPKDRETTRTVRVFEIELGKGNKSNISCPAATPLASTTEEPALMAEPTMPLETGLENFENYTVAKNDTLQKISKKFYGTTKKWTKIYAANKDILRGPDKLYPGQTIKIPSGSKLENRTEKADTSNENLK